MRLIGFLLSALLALILTGCATPAPAILGDRDGNPVGTLRLAQIRAITDKAGLSDPQAYDAFIRRNFEFISPYWDAEAEARSLLDQLHQAGLSEADLDSGSIAIGQVYCCNGPYEFIYRLFAYVPPPFKLVQWDIVEVGLGAPAGSSRRAEVNTVTRLVHRYKQPPFNCAWTPNDKRLWTRILYCEGLKEEGWVRYTPLWREYGHTWLKAPGAGQAEPAK